MTGWSNGESEIQMLAYYNTGGEIKSKILAVDKDAKLVDGTDAAGKRVFLGAQYFGNLNSVGITLFDRALEWVTWSESEGSIYSIDTAPEITLNGPNTIEVPLGESYDDQGATAYDDIDGDLTANIEITNSVVTSSPGTYQVSYFVEDSNDNYASAVRNVIVVDNTFSPLHIALICKNSECTNDNKDIPLKEHLESLGHSVSTYKDKDHSWDPTTFDVVIISESVKSSKTEWLKNQAVPILTVEGANSDELAMGDGGSSSGGNSKNIIITESHPITAGFTTGVPIQVTTSTKHLGHMTGWSDGSGIVKLAHYDTSGSEEMAKILIVDKDGELVDGSFAAEKRVFFGAQYFANLTADGITLFDNSLDWLTLN